MVGLSLWQPIVSTSRVQSRSCNNLSKRTAGKRYYWQWNGRRDSRKSYWLPTCRNQTNGVPGSKGAWRTSPTSHTYTTCQLTQVVADVAVGFRLRDQLSGRCHAAVAIHSSPGGRRWRRSVGRASRQWQGQVAHGHVIQSRPVEQRTDRAWPYYWRAHISRRAIVRDDGDV